MPSVDVAHAVEDTADGCRLRLNVHPGRDETSFPVSYDAWRRRLVAHVDAPARAGAANRALVAAVAAFFEVAAHAVGVESGATARAKSVVVAGVTAKQAAARLRTALEEAA